MGVPGLHHSLYCYIVSAENEKRDSHAAANKSTGKIGRMCLLLPTRFSAAWLLFAILFVRGALAGPFTQLVIFGDSLADVGNISQATFGTFPGPYYYNNRFSNGPVFTEALSVGLGLSATIRSTAGGNNFAYGGAQSTGTGGFNGLFIRDVDEQVDQFLNSRTLDPGALFLVYAGANDLVSGGQTNVNVPVSSLAEDIGRLVAAGARQFLVPNLPLLGFAPRFNSNASEMAEYNTRSMQFNAALDTALDAVTAVDSEIVFHRLDVAGLFSDALVDPAAFGFTNVTDAAAPGLSPGTASYNTNMIAENPNEYLFWDDLHPTATVHAFLAERALDLLLALRGDYNENGAVDAADYTLWQDTLGQTGAGLAADGGRNGVVDPTDFMIWKDNFGAAAASAGSLDYTSAVPEPAAVGILLTATILIGACKRNRRVGGFYTFTTQPRKRVHGLS